MLKPDFEIDLEYCPNWGGQLKIITTILAAPMIERILTHLGSRARAPSGYQRVETFGRLPDGLPDLGPAPRVAEGGWTWRGESAATGCEL